MPLPVLLTAFILSVVSIVSMLKHEDLIAYVSFALLGLVAIILCYYRKHHG